MLIDARGSRLCVDTVDPIIVEPSRFPESSFSFLLFFPVSARARFRLSRAFREQPIAIKRNETAAPEKVREKKIQGKKKGGREREEGNEKRRQTQRGKRCENERDREKAKEEESERR